MKCVNMFRRASGLIALLAILCVAPAVKAAATNHGDYVGTNVMYLDVTENPKIKIIWDSVVTEIKGSDTKGVEKIIIKNVKTGELTERDADGIFMAIGNTPATGLFEGQIELDKDGYILVKDGSKTSIEGVFAAGDVRDPHFRQAVIAAGTGCRAAIEVDRFLSG